MKKVIGIISYLPDDENKRQARFTLLIQLIETCSFLFNLPIFIVTQNYNEKEREYLIGYKKVSLSDNYTRLGIVGARKQLREWFIHSEYDYLIMLDDDCRISGSKSSADTYLSEIDGHPHGWGEFRGSQLKLFAICKEILSQVEYRDINPELGEGFEDTVFYSDLNKKFSNRGFSFNRNTDLKEVSTGVNDVLSTWYDSSYNLKEMLCKTEELTK